VIAEEKAVVVVDGEVRLGLEYVAAAAAAAVVGARAVAVPVPEFGTGKDSGIHTGPSSLLVSVVIGEDAWAIVKKKSPLNSRTSGYTTGKEKEAVNGNK